MTELSLNTNTSRYRKAVFFVAFAAMALIVPAVGFAATPSDGFSLSISTNAERANAIEMNGTGTLASGEVAVFLDSSGSGLKSRHIRFVEFYVNGHRFKREWRTPYDLGGTFRDGLARLVETDRVFNEGPNTIRAKIVTRNRGVHWVEGVLNVLPTSPSIVEIASGNEDFSILVEAVVAANLVDVLSEPGPFTVFAPTNQAFVDLLSELGISKEELFADQALLTKVLTYHVLGNALFSPAILAQSELTTLEGEAITVDPNGPRVNDSMLIGVDIAASNGVIHVIDRVLLPPSITDPEETLAEIASSNPDFSILVEAAVATGLVGILSVESTDLTVFAPTNGAFVELLGALGLSKDELFANKALLTTVLLYHLVNQELFAGEVLAEPELFPMESEPIMVDAEAVQLNGIDILATDIDASNGVIHVIDGVLVPPAALELLGD